MALEATQQAMFNKAMASAFTDPDVRQAAEAAIMTRVNEEVDRRLAATRFSPPIADARALAGLGTWPPPEHLLRTRSPDEQTQHVMRVHDDLAFLRLFSKAGNRPMGPLLDAYTDQLDGEFPSQVRTALDSVTSTGASEWVPTVLSGEFYRLIRDAAVIAPMFQEQPMASGKLDLGTVGGPATAYLHTEGVAVQEDAAIKSAKANFEAKTLMAWKDVSTELSDDALVVRAGAVQQEIAEGIALGIDDLILNGDETGTHMDTTHSARQHGWDGLRHQALINAAGANVDLSTFDLDHLVALLAGGGKYLAEVGDMFWVFPVKAWWKLPSLVNNATDKQAVFLPGVFGGPVNPAVKGLTGITLLGLPVILCTAYRQDLGATGVSEASANTYTSILAVRRKPWRLGVRRQVEIRVALNDAASLKAGTMTVAGSWRGQLKHLEASTATSVACGIKIS